MAECRGSCSSTFGLDGEHNEVRGICGVSNGCCAAKVPRRAEKEFYL